MLLSVNDFVSDNNIAEVSPVECNDSKTLLNLECKGRLTVSLKEALKWVFTVGNNTFSICSAGLHKLKSAEVSQLDADHIRQQTGSRFLLCILQSKEISSKEASASSPSEAAAAPLMSLLRIHVATSGPHASVLSLEIMKERLAEQAGRQGRRLWGYLHHPAWARPASPTLSPSLLQSLSLPFCSSLKSKKTTTVSCRHGLNLTKKVGWKQRCFSN